MDQEGKPKFEKVIHRLKRSSETTIAKLSQKEPVYCYLFDCLYLDGRPLVDEPLDRRYDWLKVKVDDSADCLVIGYTQGSGSRSEYFGALHLAENKNDELKYRGKVGTGFDEQSLKEIANKLDGLEETSKSIEEKIDQPKDTMWGNKTGG